MISLCIWIGILLGSMLLMAWVLAVSARAVGSPRGRLRVGVVAVLLVFGLNIVFTIGGALLPNQVVVAVILVVAQFLVTFLILGRLFALSVGRSFAPFGALIAFNVAELALLLGVVRPFLTEAFVLPTSSMSPTLDPGDRVLVDKITPPRRWDLVAYWNTSGQRAVYCKRLVGLPGERLRFDNGTVYVNDQPAAVPAILAGRCHAPIGQFSPAGPRYRDGQTIALGSNEFFFIGDNIEISADSRLYGPSDRSSLIGVVDLIYWPPTKLRIVR